jgi:hypothetical protein
MANPGIVLLYFIGGGGGLKVRERRQCVRTCMFCACRAMSSPKNLHGAVRRTQAHVYAPSHGEHATQTENSKCEGWGRGRGWCMSEAHNDPKYYQACLITAIPCFPASLRASEKSSGRKERTDILGWAREEDQCCQLAAKIRKTQSAKKQLF